MVFETNLIEQVNFILHMCSNARLSSSFCSFFVEILCGINQWQNFDDFETSQENDIQIRATALLLIKQNKANVLDLLIVWLLGFIDAIVYILECQWVYGLIMKLNGTRIHWLDRRIVRKELDIMPIYHYVQNQGKLIYLQIKNFFQKSGSVTFLPL